MKQDKCFICGKLVPIGELVEVQYTSGIVLVCRNHPGVEVLYEDLRSKRAAALKKVLED